MFADDDSVGLTANQFTALMQVCEALFKVVITVLWSTLTYRLCYTAFAKKEQSMWGMTKTMISAVGRSSKREALAIAVLVSATGLSGFYATLATGVLRSDRIMSSIETFPVIHDIEGLTYTSQYQTHGAMLAAGLFAPPHDLQLEDFVEASLEPSPAERAELSEHNLVYGEASERPDNLGTTWTIAAGRPEPCGMPVQMVGKQEPDGWVVYLGLECLWNGYERALQVPDLRTVKHPYIGQVNSLLPDVEDLNTYWRSGCNISIAREVLYKIGENTTAVNKMLQHLDMYTIDERDRMTLYPDERRCSTGATGAVHIRHNVRVAEGRSIELLDMRYCGQNLHGNYTQALYRYREILVAGSISSVTDSEFELYNSVEKAPYNKKRWKTSIDRRVGQSQEERVRQMRSLLEILKDGTLTGRIRKLGYSYDKVLAFALPIVLLFVLSLVWEELRHPFETNTLIENIYMAGDTVGSDCALNEKKKTRSWWQPEKWAELDLDRGAKGKHIFPTFSGMIFQLRKPSEPLATLHYKTDLKDFR